MNQEVRPEVRELKDSETKVTDELRGDLRYFCAELQQTFRKEMELGSMQGEWKDCSHATGLGCCEG